MDYLEKLRKYLDSGEMVEIVADQLAIGTLSEVGDDYLAIVRVEEREITEQVEITEGDKKGTFEEQKLIQVIELETVIRFTDIRSISRTLRKTTK